MESDKLQQLEKEVQQLQQDLQTTYARLQQVSQELQALKSGSAIQPRTNFLKPPYYSNHSFENFIGLRLIHLVGIVVLVIGLSLGVKYAIDKQLISEFARIALAYAAGTLLYLLSWRLKKKYIAFSAILFSGAMASLYFTSYAAFVYYNLLSAAVAFVIMIVLTLFTVYQALTYNRQEIAVLGLVGAYAIPFLISSNAGRAELLFSYIAIINTAVIFLAFKKGWKSVAVLAQISTWLLLIGWALTRFAPSQKGIAFLFGGFFFLLFSIHALIHKMIRKEALRKAQAQQLLVNNLLLYALLVVVMNASVKELPFWAINGGFFLFTAAQAALAFYFMPEEVYIKKGLALFSVSFLLLFIANRWDGISVTLLWLLTDVVLFVVCIGLKSVWLRVSAMVLMGVTLAKLVFLDSLRFNTIQKIIAYLTLGILLLVVGFFYQRFKERLFPQEGGNV